MNTTAAQRYAAHVAELCCRYDDALAAARLTAVVVAAGAPMAIHEDDQLLPFKANPHLLQWAPLAEHPDTILSYQPGHQPVLHIYVPDDYWHLAPPIPELVLNGPFDLKIVRDGMELVRHIKTLPARTAYVGELRQREDSFGLRRVNPRRLIEALHEQRTRKTPWEVDNMRTASQMGAAGHRAAEQAFFAGASEFEIQSAFRSASNSTDNEMPYPAIVALNRHASALHYQRLDRARSTNDSLLIDAGASHAGYASDITRCHATDPDFAALIQAMHDLQQSLCAGAVPGADFRELHRAAHHALAALLDAADILRCSVDEAVANGISRAFFPHGLGHFLGLQVHDVGALLASGAGQPAAADDPYLRLTRILVPGNVLTIEPGLYFIDVLLEQLRGDRAKQLNWPRIEALHRFGGIRIEDNLLITATGNENLTRDAFALPAQPSAISESSDACG